uniref:uncharacterized protein LOC103790112 n=1 Tax=Callithrix jacchus TaxID=9483 RepID=UPI0023DD4BEA|nr:uncharacterized protein LOC103790112 [Callithrix jacchus]XP_054106509.1 uncharacterized protein LOC103790112 [Callithrix jacchus]XP_054106510.1 uncharacterized protein LOC103790112 [Callithrix jacchus]XP_054106511.1 uncharacterized protein LOC103790112 [Callithrix jacchus]XP_054106512.1 uncharacterized protein LOC103790112 [Callithrix jacchus]
MLENYRNLVWLGLSISKSVISLLEKRKRPWRVARAKRPIASEHLNGNIVLTPRTVYNFRKGALCCLIPQGNGFLLLAEENHQEIQNATENKSVGIYEERTIGEGTRCLVLLFPRMGKSENQIPGWNPGGKFQESCDGRAGGGKSKHERLRLPHSD